MRLTCGGGVFLLVTKESSRLIHMPTVPVPFHASTLLVSAGPRAAARAESAASSAIVVALELPGGAAGRSADGDESRYVTHVPAVGSSGVALANVSAGPRC